MMDSLKHDARRQLSGANTEESSSLGLELSEDEFDLELRRLSNGQVSTVERQSSNKTAVPLLEDEKDEVPSVAQEIPSGGTDNYEERRKKEQSLCKKEVRSSSQNIKFGETKVYRYFEDNDGSVNLCWGTVTESYKCEGHGIVFKILYEDGDFEEVTQQELQDLLLKSEPKQDQSSWISSSHDDWSLCGDEEMIDNEEERRKKKQSLCEKEVQSSSQNIRLGETKVCRYFEDDDGSVNLFWGTVTESYKFDGHGIVFKILYEDGDFEEVTQQELQDLLLKSEPKQDQSSWISSSHDDWSLCGDEELIEYYTTTTESQCKLGQEKDPQNKLTNHNDVEMAPFHTATAATDVSQKQVGTKRQRGFSKATTLADLRRYFHLPIKEASKQLNVSDTIIKRLCRKFGVRRWPYRKIQSTNKKRNEACKQKEKLNNNDSDQNHNGDDEETQGVLTEEEGISFLVSPPKKSEPGSSSVALSHQVRSLSKACQPLDNKEIHCAVEVSSIHTTRNNTTSSSEFDCGDMITTLGNELGSLQRTVLALADSTNLIPLNTTKGKDLEVNKGLGRNISIVKEVHRMGKQHKATQIPSESKVLQAKQCSVIEVNETLVAKEFPKGEIYTGRVVGYNVHQNGRYHVQFFEDLSMVEYTKEEMLKIVEDTPRYQARLEQETMMVVESKQDAAVATVTDLQNDTKQDDDEAAVYFNPDTRDIPFLAAGSIKLEMRQWEKRLVLGVSGINKRFSDGIYHGTLTKRLPNGKYLVEYKQDGTFEEISRTTLRKYISQGNGRGPGFSRRRAASRNKQGTERAGKILRPRKHQTACNTRNHLCPVTHPTVEEDNAPPGQGATLGIKRHAMKTALVQITESAHLEQCINSEEF